MKDSSDAIPAMSGRKAPYTQVANWVMLHPSLSRNGRLLYVYLSMYVNVSRRDSLAWPSRRNLASLLGYTKPDAVDPLLKELEAVGAVEIHRRANEKNHHDTNVYLVHETPPAGYEGPQYPGSPVTPSLGVAPKSGVGVAPKSGVGVAPKSGPELEVLELEVFELEELKNLPSPATAVEDLFARFYANYPKKVNKADARRKFEIAIKRQKVDPEIIIAAAARYAEYEKARGTERRFIKGPDVWLHKGCWEDELAAERIRKAEYQGPYQNPVDHSEYEQDLADVLRSRHTADSY